LIDRVQRSVPRVASVERLFRHLGGSPIPTRAPGLILDDSSGERIGEARWPSNEREGKQSAQVAECFASGEWHDRFAKDSGVTASIDLLQARRASESARMARQTLSVLDRAT
jgi:hypothetical protein